MSAKRETGDGWEPGPNPVGQIILTRTVQVGYPAAVALYGLHNVVPPQVFAPCLYAGAGLVTAGLSAYFVATFYARTRFPGTSLWVRLPPGWGNTVALTFDDGPHPDTTPRLLDALADAGGAKATFFLVGARASAYPHLAARVAREGHAIGVHGFHHRTMVLQSAREIEQDIADAQHRIEDATGQALTDRLLRPPYGFKTWTLARAAQRLGWQIVGWSLDPRDYDSVDAATLVERAKAATAGEIILLHERPGSLATADCISPLVRHCRGAGLELVPLTHRPISLEAEAVSQEGPR